MIAIVVVLTVTVTIAAVAFCCCRWSCCFVFCFISVVAVVVVAYAVVSSLGGCERERHFKEQLQKVDRILPNFLQEMWKMHKYDADVIEEEVS